MTIGVNQEYCLLDVSTVFIILHHSTALIRVLHVKIVNCEVIGFMPALYLFCLVCSWVLGNGALRQFSCLVAELVLEMSQQYWQLNASLNTNSHNGVELERLSCGLMNTYRMFYGSYLTVKQKHGG